MRRVRIFQTQILDSKCRFHFFFHPGCCFLGGCQVGGLASENVRWAEAVGNFKNQERNLCGDVLLITAFISYLGYFTKQYRLQLMLHSWRPYFSQLKVRKTADFTLSDPDLCLSGSVTSSVSGADTCDP